MLWVPWETKEVNIIQGCDLREFTNSGLWSLDYPSERCHWYSKNSQFQYCILQLDHFFLSSENEPCQWYLRLYVAVMFSKIKAQFRACGTFVSDPGRGIEQNKKKISLMLVYNSLKTVPSVFLEKDKMCFEIEARDEGRRTCCKTVICFWYQRLNPVEGWDILLPWMYYEQVYIICNCTETCYWDMLLW